MKKTIWFEWQPLIFLGLMIFPSYLHAQTSGERPVVVGYATHSGITAPLWIAKDSGMFKKHRLEVELVWIQGGSRVVQALVAGNIDIGMTGGPDPVSAILGGAEIKIIASNGNSMDGAIVAHKNITRPAELKGKKFAAGIIGSTGYLRAEFALRRWGLEPNKDVFLVPLGNTPTRFTALQSGQVAATLVAPPEDLMAKKMGYNIIGSLDDVEYLNNVVIVSNKAGQQSEMIDSFLKGFIEGIWFLKTRKAESMQIMSRHLKYKDVDVLEHAYQHYATTVRQKPYPTLEGTQMLLSELAKKDSRARSTDPGSFFDLKYLRRIDDSGFIDSLYKR
jgi:NitT/TauT family transport system substrate-binding protein